jgi:hypothetical protein
VSPLKSLREREKRREVKRGESVRKRRERWEKEEKRL